MMLRAMQPLDALDLEYVRADSADLRSHRTQHPREVLHFGLARRVFDYAEPARTHCRHHDVLGGAHRWHIEPDTRAGEPRRMRFDVAVAHLNARAERPDTHDMQIHRPPANPPSSLRHATV